jgi:hypothetical protein
MRTKRLLLFRRLVANPVDVPKFVGPGVLAVGVRRYHARAMMLAPSVTRADGFEPARGRGAGRRLQVRRASSGSSTRLRMLAPQSHAIQTMSPSTPPSRSPG